MLDPLAWVIAILVGLARPFWAWFRDPIMVGGFDQVPEGIDRRECSWWTEAEMLALEVKGYRRVRKGLRRREIKAIGVEGTYILSWNPKKS
jgi:hypothetical protein